MAAKNDKPDETATTQSPEATAPDLAGTEDLELKDRLEAAETALAGANGLIDEIRGELGLEDGVDLIEAVKAMHDGLDKDAERIAGFRAAIGVPEEMSDEDAARDLNAAMATLDNIRRELGVEGMDLAKLETAVRDTNALAHPMPVGDPAIPNPPTMAAEDDVADVEVPSELNIGEAYLTFTAGAHQHETPRGVLKCRECIAFVNGVGPAPTEPVAASGGRRR